MQDKALIQTLRNDIKRWELSYMKVFSENERIKEENEELNKRLKELESVRKLESNYEPDEMMAEDRFNDDNTTPADELTNP